jgi:hypothetical protein
MQRFSEKKIEVEKNWKEAIGTNAPLLFHFWDSQAQSQ